MKEQKTRGLSIRWKIILPTCFIVILLAVVMGVNSYINIKNGMVEMGVEEAAMAVGIAAGTVDGDVLETISADSVGSDTYNELLEELREVRDQCGIMYLYTIYTDGSNVYYGIDTDEEDMCDYGEAFDTSYEELQGVFEGEAYVQNYIQHLEYGDLITAYMPVYNSAGKVVGAVGCDYDASGVGEKISSTMRNVIIISCVCLVLAIVLLNMVVMMIIRSLRVVDQKLYELVHNEGDLTQKIDVHTGDEMEQIAGNVNALLEYIRTIMLNISKNSVFLNGSSRSVAQNLTSAETSITDVSSTMEQMSAAMQESNASLNQINESIRQTYTAIEEIYTQAEDSSSSSEQIMNRASDTYDVAQQEQEQARDAAARMETVVQEKIDKSKEVEKISQLTNEIINIAEQTNLLSLNASIEAARAGEAGKGFAVVADEIGKLASNSSEAANQIQRVSQSVIETVGELAAVSQEMITFMDETAMGGYNKLLETCHSYKDDVGDMSRLMREFAAQSETIRRTIDNIRESVEAVNVAVEESTLGVTSVTEKSVDLTSSVSDIEQEANSNLDIANELSSEVHKFRLE